MRLAAAPLLLALTACGSGLSIDPVPVPPQRIPCPPQAVSQPVCPPVEPAKAGRILGDVLIREKALETAVECRDRRIDLWERGWQRCSK